jgi:hypothetical protein
MSKIKNHFHDEIEAQALERHEQSEPDVEEAEQSGWVYKKQYQDLP